MNATNTNKIKINDRVRRIQGKGCFGVVQDVRLEITGSADDAEKSPMINVLWDNGTQSYLSQEGLEIVK